MSLKNKSVLRLFSLLCFCFISHLKLDASSYDWRILHPKTSPPIRVKASMVFASDQNHPAEGKIILFGGYNPDKNRYLDDTWTFDATKKTWKKLHPPTSPPPRGFAAATFDPINGQMLIYGGIGTNDTSLGDLWSYDISSGTWSELTPRHTPPRLANAGMVFEPLNGNIILFGGVSKKGALNETWSYDPLENIWNQLEPKNAPSPRSGFTMNLDPTTGKIILFGGCSFHHEMVFNDTWSYDIAANHWTELHPKKSPEKRFNAMADFDPTSNKIILFGGRQPITAKRDTWSYDSKNNAWKNLTNNESMSRLSGSTMNFDPISREMILFGGLGLMGRLSDSTFSLTKK